LHAVACKVAAEKQQDRNRVPVFFLPWQRGEAPCVATPDAREEIRAGLIQ
jgi:hypothetical protein